MSDVIDAYAERKRSEVMQDTWGHLAPKQGQKYTGFFTFAVGCYGGLSPEVLSCWFKGLPDSPWFFSALQDYIFTLDMEAGLVYRFDGCFMNDAFNGEVSVILDTNKN